MKKKFVGVIGLLAIVAVATFNLNMNLSSTSLLTLSNVEALASEGTTIETRTCYKAELDVYYGVLKYDCRVSGCNTMRYQRIKNQKSYTCTYYK